MLDDQESIYEIPYSLPSSSHMAAVVSRTPSNRGKVETNKFMPDFGGILELPGTHTKQNGLRAKIPFDTNPHYVRIHSENEEDDEKIRSNDARGPDCLIAAQYLCSDGDDDLYRCDKSFSTLRAVGKTLFLDLVKSIPCEPRAPETHEFMTYGQVPYSYPILGLKYCDTVENYVIVKFAQGIKLIMLNDCYRVPLRNKTPEENSRSQSDEIDEEGCGIGSPLPDQSAVQTIDSFAEKPGIELKDASLSKSQNWLYIASHDTDNIYVKLYDLSASKQCFSVVTKARDDDVKIRTQASKSLCANRKKSLRSFIPSKPSIEDLYQIICDPSHLMNSLMITSNRVSLIDPRVNSVVMDFADKFKMSSASPTERFRQIEFSTLNHQQFYLMSDEKLRALDKRYPSKDLNISDHMIDVLTHDVMTMRLSRKEELDFETLCLSAFGHICIFSFDRSQRTHSLFHTTGDLINPRSMHQPIHDPSPIEVSGEPADELYGLAVCSDRIFDSKDIIFSTLQLSQEGHVCVRGFPTSRDNFLEFEYAVRKPKMLTGSSSIDSLSIENPANPNISRAASEYKSYVQPNDIDQLNILNPDYVLEAEKFLGSKRARMKYDWMKKKLRSE